MARYTLLIPTYNRPAHLRSLLGYLAARRFAHPVRVLDSSSGDALEQNRATVAAASLTIHHHIYDPATPGAEKFTQGTHLADTPYCSLCPDDDILLTSHVDEMLDLLDRDRSLVAVHGNYINFKPGEEFDISDIFYWAPSLVADDALQRIVEQMKNYQATFYAIHRTEVLRDVLSQYLRMPTGLGKELLASSLTLIAGGVARLPHFYMARETSPSVQILGWHPYHFLSDRPQTMFEEYTAYRPILVERILADRRCAERYDRARVERILDLVHLRYLTPMLSSPVLDHIIEHSLRDGSKGPEIAAGVWQAFETVPRAGGLSALLTQVRVTLGQPSNVKRVAGYLWHFLATFLALAREGDMKVTASKGLRKIFLRRHCRDESQRRYAVFYSFLDRRLPGGRRASAAEINALLEQLDDYV